MDPYKEEKDRKPYEEEKGRRGTRDRPVPRKTTLTTNHKVEIDNDNDIHSRREQKEVARIKNEENKEEQKSTDR